MAASYNERTYTRIEVNLSVTVEVEGGASFEATLIDVSAGGLRIESAEKPPLGTLVTCTFFGGSHALIEVRGVVCSIDASSFGVRISAYDAVSREHFKALLLQLADDPHHVENEILLNLDALPEAD